MFTSLADLGGPVRHISLENTHQRSHCLAMLRERVVLSISLCLPLIPVCFFSGMVPTAQPTQSKSPTRQMPERLLLRLFFKFDDLDTAWSANLGDGDRSRYNPMW